MDRRRRATLFALFIVSGFCGLLYQVVWLRLAFAAFGIITPVVSVVVSVFMLGLAVGSVAAGQAAAVFARRTGRSALYLYAIAELVIGAGAFAVPPLLHLGKPRSAVSARRARSPTSRCPRRRSPSRSCRGASRWVPRTRSSWPKCARSRTPTRARSATFTSRT